MRTAVKENNLGKDKISRLILRLAIPAMLAQFVNVLYGIVDRIFISQIPEIGGLALAGVGVTIPIITLVTSFSFLVGLGGAPLLSMRLGEEKRDEAQKIIANCFVMLIIISLVITALFLSIKKPMLMLFGASEKSYQYANQYFTIYVSGAIFSILTLGLNGFISCQGFAKVSMFTVLLGAILNIALDPLLIFTFKMGVAGAAWATLISQAASCLWVVIFLLGKRTAVKLSFKGLSSKIISRVMALGVSPFMIMATDSLVLILFNIVLQKYGGNQMGDLYVTAATIVTSCMQIITMPMGGITLGCQPILSFNYGAKQVDRVKTAFWGMLIMCVIFTSIMLIVTMSAPKILVGIFTRDPEITAVAVWGIRIFTAAIIPLAGQYCFVDSLTALGQAGKAITLSLTRKILIMTTLIFTLPVFFGAKATFFAEPIADTLSCIISGTVFFSVFGKLLKKRSALTEYSKGLHLH